MPCASTASTSAGRSPALASAWRMTRSWEGPLGAVRPLEAPSWLTAEPRIVARIGWPLRCASERRSSSEHAGALGKAGAVGRLGEGLAAPVGGEAALAGELGEDAGGGDHRRAAGQGQPHSPLRSAWEARCSATSEEEQAVSTVIAGPSRPSA